MRTDTGRDELLIPQKGLVLVKKFGDVEDIRVGDGVNIGPGTGAIFCFKMFKMF
jgi:hypothetical protein